MALVKAVIINLDKPPYLPIPVMFNPPEYKLSKTVHYAEAKTPGQDEPKQQFVNGNSETLSLELFFDTTDTGIDVRTRTMAISHLAEIPSGTDAPPKLMLLWGSLAFKGFLVSVNQHFENFNSLGLPLRARLSVEFKGFEPLESWAAEVPLAQAEQAMRYVITPRDSLQSVATKAYQDPGQWRTIASANNIDDPRRLASGVRLQIPKRR